MTTKSPFKKVTARSIIFWLIIGSFLGTVILELIAISFKSVLTAKNFDLENINFKDPLFTVLIANSLFYGLVGSWLLFHVKRSHLKLKFLFGKLPRSNNWFPWLFMILPILLFSLGSGQIIYYLTFLIQPEFVTSLIQNKLFLTAQETSFPLIYNLVQVLSIIIFAPLIEEILFRGILLQRWSVKWGVLPGILASSLIFGCLHFNVLGLINFGLVMALLYLRTKTLFLPIIFHALNNLIAVAMEVSATIFNERETFYTVEQIQSSWWQGLIAIALSLPFLILFWRNNWQLIPESLPYFANRDRAAPQRS